MLDWRKYFNLETSSDEILEKANPYHKPAGKGGGQFTSKGFGHAGLSPVAAHKAVDFAKAAPLVQERLLKQAIVTARKGAAASSTVTMSSLNAIVSQATGSPQGHDLTLAVGKAAARLQDKGELAVNRKEQMLKREGGHWVYSDPVTKQVIKNPLTGKPGFPAKGQEAEIATRDVHAISLTPKGSQSLGPAEKKGFDLKQSLSVTRPSKFDPVPGGMADQALAIRRETFPSSKLAPQGRVHANEHNAPEMLKTEFKTGEERKANPLSPTGRQQTLHEAHPDRHWYDATSSARANVGAMTGDKDLLTTVRLQGKVPNTPAIEAAKKLGLESPDKPYYAILNPGKTGINITPDMVKIGNLADNHSGIKKVVKAVDTPRLYGARATGTAFGTQKEILKQAGLVGTRDVKDANGKVIKTEKFDIATPEDKAKATTLANALVHNFAQTPMAQFEAKFKAIAKELPDNFVFTNPVNGFRMPFQKHDVATSRFNMKDQDGNTFKVSSSYPLEPNKNKTRNSAMPLFVQSMDAAVKDEVMVALKNPFSKHDAFGITNKADKPKLDAIVARAYEKINKANPIGALAQQMKDQHRAQIGTQVRKGGSAKKGYTYKTYTEKDYIKSVAAIDKAVDSFFPPKPGQASGSGRPPAISIPSVNDHLELE